MAVLRGNPRANKGNRGGRKQGSCGSTPKRDGSGKGIGNRGKRK